MSDSLSLLYTKSKTDYIVHFEKMRSDPDPLYFPDLKTHLNENPEYREERREWTKGKPTEHTAWSLFRIRDEFCRHYIEPFYRDVELFLSTCPSMTPREAAGRLCKEWKGYSNVYGVEFVERTIIQLSWRNGDTNAREAAQSFRDKWIGYKSIYSEDELTAGFKICMK